MFGKDGAAESLGNFAQFGGVPSARLHLVLEEVLHLFGVRRRAAVDQDATNVRGDVGRWSWA